MTDDQGSLLTAFQIEVAQLFFSLPASGGFLLAGGGALLAQGLTARPTKDLDFFTRPGAGDVGLARDQFLAAAGERGWRVDRVQDSDTFCRLLIHGSEDLLVDLALACAPGRPASASSLVRRSRRTNSPDARSSPCSIVPQLATSSTSTRLSRRFTKTELLDLAREVDRGFDTRVFADMLRHLARYSDVDLALGDVDIPALRAFFRQWITELDRSED